MTESLDIEESNPSDVMLTRTLRWGAFLCLVGWSWSHLYWEGPYGALLWNDATFAFAQRLGVTWDRFVGDGDSAGWVQQLVRALGWLYVVLAVLCLTLRSRRWRSLVVLALGSGLLALMSYAKFVQSGHQLPMLIEHGGQALAPSLLGLALVFGPRHRVTVGVAIVALLATFLGHGSYALGLWPTPANYYGMTSTILSVDHAAANAFLRVVGALDFLICIGIFIPLARRGCAIYAALWGFLTAIARPVSGMAADLNYWGADQYLHEAILRAPHFLIPFYLFLLWRADGTAKATARVADLERSPSFGDPTVDSESSRS